MCVFMKIIMNLFVSLDLLLYICRRNLVNILYYK